jgi:hypothetical protein
MARKSKGRPRLELLEGGAEKSTTRIRIPLDAIWQCPECGTTDVVELDDHEYDARCRVAEFEAKIPTECERIVLESIKLAMKRGPHTPLAAAINGLQVLAASAPKGSMIRKVCHLYISFATAGVRYADDTINELIEDGE